LEQRLEQWPETEFKERISGRRQVMFKQAHVRGLFSSIENLLRRFESMIVRRISGDQGTVPENDLRTKLVVHTFNYFLSKIAPGLSGLLAVVIFVRLSGYEQYGRYAVVFATVTAFSAGVAGWLSQSILRFQSIHHETVAADSFNRAINVGLLLSTLIGGAFLGVVLWLSGRHSPAVLAISVALYGAMLGYAVEMTRLQASLDSRGVVRMEAVRAVGALGIPLLLMLGTWRRDYSLLLFGIFCGYLIPIAGQILSQKGRAAILDLKRPFLAEPGLTFLRDLWSYGWPVALWLFCQQSLVVSDRYFVQRFWGYSAAGIYASMYDAIVRSFSLIFAPITLAVHTVLMHHWNTGNRDRTKRMLAEAIKYETLLFLPVAAALYVARAWISRLVLGHANVEAAPVVLPLAIGGFLWQLALLAHKPLEILCQTKRILLGGFVALAANVAGNYFLTPRFGYRAAAYLSIMSGVVYLLMLLILVPGKSFQSAIASGKDRATAIVPAEEVGV
jgi:O-antigen/teichoic acid export membrane protein